MLSCSPVLWYDIIILHFSYRGNSIRKEAKGSLSMNLKRKNQSGYGMGRACALVVLLALLFMLFLPGTALTEKDRVVLTIGDTTYRATPRMSGDDQLAIWKYLEE